MEQNYSVIACENLKARMQRAEMSIQTLADLSGVPTSTISNMFTGRTGKASFDNIYAMAKALDTSINEIMGDNLTQIVANDKIIDGYENRLKERMEMYNERLSEQRDMYDKRLADQEKQYESRLAGLENIIASLKRRSMFHIAAITALIAFALFLIFIDARIPDWGLIQYAYESMSGIADVVEGLV